tara:strand:+ start:9082 stop:9642 length:561 start_codon:yes stop_codon:yes gene_type:complete
MSILSGCVISSAFLGSSIYMMITENKDSKYKLYNSLSDKAKKHYENIKRERMMIWIKSSVIGVIVALLVNTFGGKMVKGQNGQCFNKSCMSASIFFVVQYLVYSLHPKSDWVLNHVENSEQTKLWLEHYKYMKRKWHIGLVLGIIGYFLAIYHANLKIELDGYLFMQEFNRNPYPRGIPLDVVNER